MKQKFSTIFFLLLLLLAGSRVVAQNAPKPFDIEQPSLRVFLPAPELATGRAVVACPGGGEGNRSVRRYLPGAGAEPRENHRRNQLRRKPFPKNTEAGHQGI